MILSQRVVKPVVGPRTEAFSWPTINIVDEDRQRARRHLRKVEYMSKFLSNGRVGSEREVEAASHAFATKRVMALAGVQNRQVIFDSSRSWTTIMKETTWGTLRSAGFNPSNQEELQGIANNLAATPDAERLFARFTNYTALHDDGGAFPCLVSETIGTIETGVNGRIRLTEAAFGLNNAPLLVETRELTLSPLSAEFKLGLSSSPLGSRLEN